MGSQSEIQLALWDELMRNITYSEHLSVAMCNSVRAGNPGARGLSQSLRETNENTHASLDQLLDTFLEPTHTCLRRNNARPANVQNNDGRPANVQNNDGRPANVQNNDGRPANVQNNDGRPANVQNNDGRPANVQNNDGRPANVQNNDGRPVNVQNNYARPANVQNNDVRPANVQNNDARPANIQNIIAQPVNEQNINAQPANVQNNNALPANVQNNDALPANVQNNNALPANVQNNNSNLANNVPSRSNQAGFQNHDANRRENAGNLRPNTYRMDHMPCIDLRRAQVQREREQRFNRVYYPGNHRFLLPDFCYRAARNRFATRNQQRPRAPMYHRNEPINRPIVGNTNRGVAVPINPEGQLVITYNGSPNAEINPDNGPVIIQRGPTAPTGVPRNASIIIIPETTSYVRLTLDASQTISVYPITNRPTANPRNHFGDAGGP